MNELEGFFPKICSLTLLHLGTKEYSICNQPVLFEQLENVNKLWNNNRTVHVNEQNQNKKKKTSHVTFKLTTHSMLQFSPQTMQWIFSLSDVRVKRVRSQFLVNNILFGSAWCLVKAQIQFSLIKKIKIGRPEHSLTPHPLRPIASHFFLTYQ